MAGRQGGGGFRSSSPPPSSYRLWKAQQGGYLTTSALDRLRDYEGFSAEADGVDESLSQPYLQLIWNSTADRLPTWYRPGIAILLGLVILVITTLVLLWYSTLGPLGLNGHGPVWPNFAAGSAVLLYQFIGATENTRIRRVTSQAIRRGDRNAKERNAKEGTYWIFWHGCNSVAVGFLILGAMLELQLEEASTMLVGVVLGFTACYFAHWQKYVSGHRKVMSQFVDVAETQLILASIHFLTVFAGSSVWTLEIAWEWQVNHVVLTVLFGRASIVILNYWMIILEGGPGEDGTTTAGTAVLSPAIPGMSALLTAKILASSPASAFDQVPYLSILGVIFIYAKVLNKLIVAQATKTPIEQVDAIVWPGLALAAGGYIGLELEAILGFGPNTISVAVYCIAMLINLTIYWTHLMQEICEHVQQNIFAKVESSTKVD